MSENRSRPIRPASGPGRSHHRPVVVRGRIGKGDPVADEARWGAVRFGPSSEEAGEPGASGPAESVEPRGIRGTQTRAARRSGGAGPRWSSGYGRRRRANRRNA